MITVYGLRNCDTCRKAQKWLDAKGLEHHFKDVRAEQLKAETINHWISVAGWEVLLNRRSTTWRKLKKPDQNLLDAGRAVALMLKYPTLIKRPVFEIDSRVLVGFKDDVQAVLMG